MLFKSVPWSSFIFVSAVIVSGTSQHAKADFPSKPAAAPATAAKKPVAKQGAKYSMNAMCYLGDSKDAVPTAFNPTSDEISKLPKGTQDILKGTPTDVTDADVKQKFMVASLSKIVTTHWAITKLGPEYRFKTKIFVTPTQTAKTCNLYFAGDGDIFFGKEILGNALTQLTKVTASAGCEKVANLYYDSNLIIPFHLGSYTIQHRTDEVLNASDPARFYGQTTTKIALDYYITHHKELKYLNNTKVSFKAGDDFRKEIDAVKQTSKTVSFKSRPIYMMMKEYNSYSYNTPPNILFEKLGGRAAYADFIKDRLDFTNDDIDMYNGSGYPVNTDAARFDNRVSCAALTRIMQDLEHTLVSYQGSKQFQLADVMAMVGDSQFYTFQSLYQGTKFNQTLVAKTGTANGAITFGGMISTTAGPLFFAALTNPDPGAAKASRVYIRNLMDVLASRQTLKKLNYSSTGLMNPIDSEANLVEEGPTDTKVVVN
jgi:hypothetical protein